MSSQSFLKKWWFLFYNMKQQLEQSREGLISNIEIKLSQLKLQRDSLIQSKEANQDNGKVKISDYLKGSAIPKAPMDSKIIVNFNSPQVISSKDMVKHRLQAKSKCEQLKQLYERKRQLQQVGIHASNAKQISKIYQNKQVVDKIKKDLVNNKKKEQERLEKQRIVQQELQKVQSFLKEFKRTSKHNNHQSKYRYSQLMKQQQQRLSRYELLLNKKSIKLSQKEQLLQMTFRLIKEFPERVSKQYLQSFLLANNQFCKVFNITKQQIMRDLKVHKTLEDNFMNYEQYYEFIKSIQITNKAIKPNLNYPVKSKIAKPNVASTQHQLNLDRTIDQQIQNYLKRVFIYLDQRRQKIVERQRIQIALAKCMLYDEKKMKFNKQMIGEFSQFIVGLRKRQEMKKYYKQLDLKYISMEELSQLYTQFKGKNQYQPSNLQNQSEPPQQQEQTCQQQESNQFKPSPQPIQDQHEEEAISDFQKYGWGQAKEEGKAKFAQINQLDEYYKEVSNKYGNQIHWNNYQIYEEDFRKFNQAISKMKNNRPSDSRKIVQSFVQMPVLQVQQDNEDQQP